MIENQLFSENLKSLWLTHTLLGDSICLKNSFKDKEYESIYVAK